jgi:hypothetical protein
MNQLSYGFKINFSKNLVIYSLEEKEKENEDFLKGKCICVQEENHTYITLYNCEENPLLLFILYLFVTNILSNIRHGASYLIEK